MRKRFRTLIVLASTFAMVLVLGVGPAFADDKGNDNFFSCNARDADGFCTDPVDLGVAAENAYAPVGSHIPDAAFPAFGGQAGLALFNNPLCPFHGAVAP